MSNQTPAIRRARLLFKRGELSEAEYKERMAAEIGYAIGAQEALGLDVLVRCKDFMQTETRKAMGQ